MVRRNGIISKLIDMPLKILVLKLQKPLWTVRTHSAGNAAMEILAVGKPDSLSPTSFQTAHTSPEKKINEDLKYS